MIEQTIIFPEPGLFEWAGILIPVVVAIIAGWFAWWKHTHPPTE